MSEHSIILFITVKNTTGSTTDIMRIFTCSSVLLTNLHKAHTGINRENKSLKKNTCITEQTGDWVERVLYGVHGIGKFNPLYSSHLLK